MDYSNAYEGEATRFVPCTHEMAIDAAADMVDKLHEEGWQPSDIAVLARPGTSIPSRPIGRLTAGSRSGRRSGLLRFAANTSDRERRRRPGREVRRLSGRGRNLSSPSPQLTILWN